VRCSSPVVVDVSDLPRSDRSDASTEAALYFCVLEALQNAAKHAPGAPVRVTGRREERRLVLEVADEGPGLPPGAWTGAGGQGLQNLRDRMGAVGGTVDWQSRPGRRHRGHPVRASGSLGGARGRG
jgi:signal transduction histidine kinase